MVPLALLLRFAGRNASPLIQLVAGGIPLTAAGGLFLLRSCLPDELVRKLQQFVPQAFRPLFAKLTAVAPKEE
jgi:hypothetical protein